MGAPSGADEVDSRPVPMRRSISFLKLFLLTAVPIYRVQNLCSDAFELKPRTKCALLIENAILEYSALPQPTSDYIFSSVFQPTLTGFVATP